MKTIGTAVTLIGAVALMLAIIVAQQDYQRSWTNDGAVQSSAHSETATTVPERLAQANQ
jgi:FlaG/FlaF family flagellin (archaellin)